jgi:hypothetical protein
MLEIERLHGKIATGAGKIGAGLLVIAGQRSSLIDPLGAPLLSSCSIQGRHTGDG